MVTEAISYLLPGAQCERVQLPITINSGQKKQLNSIQLIAPRPLSFEKGSHQRFPERKGGAQMAARVAQGPRHSSAWAGRRGSPMAPARVKL